MAGAGAQVPVEGAGGVVADLHGPGPVALAGDGDLPVLQVKVAAPRVLRVGCLTTTARPSYSKSPGPGSTLT
jgi:hypothetical protein